MSDEDVTPTSPGPFPSPRPNIPPTLPDEPRTNPAIKVERSYEDFKTRQKWKPIKTALVAIGTLTGGGTSGTAVYHGWRAHDEVAALQQRVDDIQTSNDKAEGHWLDTDRRLTAVIERLDRLLDRPAK